MEHILTCPLGHTCEEARDGKIYRCWWYVATVSCDKDGNEIPGSRQHDCSIRLLPVHLSEMKKNIRQVQSAVESRGNEMVKEQTHLRLLAENARAHSKRISDVSGIQPLYDGTQGDEGYRAIGQRTPKGNGA